MCGGASTISGLARARGMSELALSAVTVSVMTLPERHVLSWKGGAKLALNPYFLGSEAGDAGVARVRREWSTDCSLEMLLRFLILS